MAGTFETDLILTLNQRVQGSSPCAPTILFNDLGETVLFVPTCRSAVIPTNLLLSFRLAFCGEIARVVIFTIGLGAVLHGVEQDLSKCLDTLIRSLKPGR